MKKQKKEKGISISRSFAYIWLATIISFIFTLDPNTPSNNNYSNFLAGLFLFNIGLGVVAFILAILPFRFFHKILNKRFSSMIPVFAIAYFLIYIFSLAFQNHGIIASQFRASPTPMPIPTFSMPTDTPTPSTTSVYVPQYVAPTIDPDPPVLCRMSANCGGGTTPLRQSECNNSTCCQIGDKWIFYKDKVQCGRDQASQGGSAPVNNNTQPSSGLNYYCYDNTYKYWYYTSSGEQCNIDNSKSACKGIVKSTYDLCMNICLTQAQDDGSACVNSYSNYSSPEYLQCISTKDAKHKSCMDGCSKPYQENTAKCN